jgi:hypothetical protein
MKKKVFFFGLTGALLVMFLAGCPNPTNSDKPSSGPDTSVLDAGIVAAEAAKAGVLVGEKETIAQSMAYVSLDDMTTFTAAINAAKAVQNNGSATQEAVNNAATTLATAVETFTGRIKNDGTKSNGFDQTELNTLIAAANAAKQGVVTSADGTNISPSVYWVTQEVLNTYTAAIAAAEGASDIDGRYTALVAAINAFKAELRPGARAKTVTITGLSAYANGAEIQAGLFETKSLQGNPQIAGMGTIQNGSATVSLYVRSSDSAWAGTGSWYVAFAIQDEEMFYITKTTRSFSADNVNVALSECDREAGSGSNDNRGEQIGEIKGTITLTNIPTPRPSRVSITAYERNGNWHAIDRAISLSNASGNTASNIAWTIPLYEHDSNGSLQGQTGTKEVVFYLYVSTGNNGGYGIDIPGNKTLDLSNLSNMDMGNLGTVSLASVTLSGSVTVSNAGQPIPRLYIEARNTGSQNIGNTEVRPTAATTQWTMTMPVQQGGAVTFGVYGFDSTSGGGNQLFSKIFAPAATTSVTDQSISGIVLDAGDISVGAMSGTMTFTGVPPTSSTIRISARYGAGNNQQWISNGNSYSVTISGATGTWTIPGDDAFLAALDSGSQTVSFRLYLYPDGSGSSSVTLPEITKTVSRDALAGIDLGSVNIGLVTLSGSITATNAGQSIPILYIDALNAGQNQIGETRLEPTTAATQWTMTISAQQGGAVTFRVYGYDSTGGGANQLFYKTFAPSQTASVTDQSISGIALDAGDVGVGRLSGVVSLTNLPNPPPYSIYLYARWYYGANDSKSLGSGSRVTITNGAWAVQKDDEFLAALESGDQRVVFDLYLEINQGESGARVATVDTTVGKNNVSNFNLGTIALPTLIKLSGTFSGSYNGTMPPYVNINPRTESGQSLTGTSITTSSGTAWAVYIPVQESAARINFNVSGHDGSNVMFEFNVSSEQTASVSNQNVSGIAIDVGSIMPNTLRVNNPPSGSYTAYVTAAYISQTNYPSISQSGNYAAIGSGSGSNVPLIWNPPNSSAVSMNVLIIANGVAKYSGWTIFINGVGAVDWSAMTEAVGNKLTISGNPPSGQLTAYAHSGSPITNTNYATVLGAYSATGTGVSPILLAWTSGYGGGTYHVLVKTAGDEYWYKNSVSFTDGAGTINWGEMTKVTTAQQLPAPENFRVTATTASSISLAWDSVSGIGVSYKVYRSTSASGPYTAFGTAIHGPSVLVSALDPDTTYYFKVAAVAYDGTEGAQSSVVSGKTLDDALYLEIANVAGNTTVKITTATISSGTAFDDLTGVVAEGQGDHPKLTWTTGAELTGVYNVMLRLVNSPNTVKYQNGVSFTGGSGAVDWNSMSTIEGGGGDALPGAKGKLTLTGFNEFNGKYVYSALMTASGKSLMGTNAVEITGTDYVMTMVQISGGTAEVPLYTTNTSGSTVADIYVPYEGSETIQTVSIMIVTDSDGKFTSSDALSFVTNYAAMIGSNPLNTGFTPSTSNGSITVSRSDTKTLEEIMADSTLQTTVKYMLMVNTQ